MRTIGGAGNENERTRRCVWRAIKREGLESGKASQKTEMRCETDGESIESQPSHLLRGCRWDTAVEFGAIGWRRR